jgi:hypothetical protein
MWIFCCGMQRSGSTLQFQIAARLVEDSGLGRRVEWVPPEKFPELRARYADEPGWKVFEHHVCTPAMAEEFERGNAVGIYSYRDLRDVFVSNMKKFSVSFDDLWSGGFLDKSLGNYRRWTALPRVLVSRYETIIADPATEVRRIAEHLALPLDEERCRRIAQEYSVESQRKRIAGFDQDSLRDGVAGARYDPSSMLHVNHLQGGIVGDWKSRLKRREVALIEERGFAWLTEHGYPITIGQPARTWLALQHKARRRLRRLLERARPARA